MSWMSHPDVLDEIWDLFESVSEEFLTYSFLLEANQTCNIIIAYLQFFCYNCDVKLPNFVARSEITRTSYLFFFYPNDR